MALQDIVTVNISLQTSGVSRAGFGVPIFIGAHNWFTERVRAYSNVTAAAVDLPAGSDELIAVTAAFAQDIPPSTVKVGRREVDSSAFTPVAASAIGQVYTLSITGTDGTKVAGSYTTVSASDSAATIATALVTALGSVTGVTVTDATGSLTVAPAASGNLYSISDVARLTQVDTTTETAAATLQAIEAVDNDFYFVAAHDHTQAFVLAMAAAMEARTKLYFVGIQEQVGIEALTVPAAAGDTLGKLKDLNYFRTSGWFHHLADTAFPEMAFIAVAAPSDPGTKIWASNRVSGVAASQDPATGLVLSQTQKNNLEARNANLIANVGGVTITRLGKVAADEFIDVVRNRDFLEARITEGLQNKQINAPVIPYTDPGINEIRSVVTSVLNRSVSTPTIPNILQDTNPYTTNFPRSADVSFADRQSRVLNASFTAFLAGAIQITNITGTLTFDNLA